jgi:hypothetical protein
MVAPERLAGLAQVVPEVIALLLRPAGLAREIRFDMDLGFRHQLAMHVEQHGTHTLRALVDGQQQRLAHAAEASAWRGATL